MNGGRACWMVTGTMWKQDTRLQVQGEKCGECDFFVHVKTKREKIRAA
jgi:hypothetical protein